MTTKEELRLLQKIIISFEKEYLAYFLIGVIIGLPIGVILGVIL